MESITREEVLIEAEALQAKLGSPHLRLLDATVLTGEDNPDAYASYLQGHLPGAAFFDHNRFSDPDGKYQLTLPDDAYLGAAIGAIGIDNNSEVVVYSTGIIAWATRVWWLLRYAGHDNVRVLNGGLAAWQQIGGAVESGDSTYAATEFNVQSDHEYFVNADGMQAALDDSEVQTVHSLPQPVYDQAHIPTSVCQPCTEFLDNWTRLLPNDQLKERLAAQHPTGRTITYCGGGVAATVNAIVCRLVGNPNVAVYDGSMAEWSGEGKPTESSVNPN